MRDGDLDQQGQRPRQAEGVFRVLVEHVVDFGQRPALGVNLSSTQVRDHVGDDAPEPSLQPDPVDLQLARSCRPSLADGVVLPLTGERFRRVARDVDFQGRRRNRCGALQDGLDLAVQQGFSPQSLCGGFVDAGRQVRAKVRFVRIVPGIQR